MENQENQINEIQELKSSDFKKAATMLKEAGLPFADLDKKVRLFGLFNPELIGFIGLEGKGNNILLRSLHVLDANQGKGLGKKLVAYLESVAKEQNSENIYLLTETAKSFFIKLGYISMDRTFAPYEIQATKEFQSLCPGATLMYKSI